MTGFTDTAKINFMKNIGKDGYKLFATYQRLIDAKEAVRLNCFLPVSDMPAALKIEGIDFSLFNTSRYGVIVGYVFVQNENIFELYEMKLETYNEYESYMRNAVLKGGNAE